jgi:hypothetical protein
LSLVLHSFERWSYLSRIERALQRQGSPGFNSSNYDSVVYLVVRPPASQDLTFVEGYGEHGGRVGIVEVELDREVVDLALAVAAHELLHTLGAEDKYDEHGNTLFPAGLAEPEQKPLFPQHSVEVMARNRPLSPTREVPLRSLRELRVGAITAREIGWSKSSGP